MVDLCLPLFKLGKSLVFFSVQFLYNNIYNKCNFWELHLICSLTFLYILEEKKGIRDLIFVLLRFRLGTFVGIRNNICQSVDNRTGICTVQGLFAYIDSSSIAGLTAHYEFSTSKSKN